MTVVTLATIPAVLALVNLLKGLGLVGKWSALAALVLGILISFSEYFFMTAEHSTSGIYTAIASGAVLGLSASGLYDIAGKVATKQQINDSSGSE